MRVGAVRIRPGRDLLGFVGQVIWGDFAELPGAWIPLVDVQEKALLIERMIGKPVFEVRSVNGWEWYVTDEIADELE